ncbi:hypothetical protein MM5_196 [Morganella phage vB_Mm5]
MSIDTKLFCATNDKIECVDAVIDAINNEIYKQRKIYIDKMCATKSPQEILTIARNQETKSLFSNVRIDSTRISHVDANFTVNGEKRSLFICMLCDNDYSDIYKGAKVIFSLGHWGNHSSMMKIVAQACKKFGDIYYTPNDGMYDLKKVEEVL